MQVLQGLALVFTDKMEESEQFFEELKAGNARLTLHHAQVAALKALMGFEQEVSGNPLLQTAPLTSSPQACTLV